MNIGIDIDDTIADTYETFFVYAQKYIIEELHREIKVNDDGSIGHSYHYASMNNMSKEENDEFLKKYIRSVLRDTKPKTFSSKYIEKLHEDGNKIIIITSRYEINRDITEKWLEDNYIIYDELVMNCKNKGETLKKYDVDIFIDDNVEYCKQADKNNIKTFLMDTRPNRNVSENGIQRVYSWPHLYYEIKRIK